MQTPQGQGKEQAAVYLLSRSIVLFDGPVDEVGNVLCSRGGVLSNRKGRKEFIKNLDGLLVLGGDGSLSSDVHSRGHFYRGFSGFCRKKRTWRRRREKR